MSVASSSGQGGMEFKAQLLHMQHIWFHVMFPGNQGTNLLTTSPADCPAALAVTSMSDYNGMPGGGATPPGITNLDDTVTDFSNYATSNALASRMVAGPGKH